MKVKVVDSTEVEVEVEDGSLALMVTDFDDNESQSTMCFKNIFESDSSIGVFVNMDRGLVVRVPFKYVKFIDKDFCEDYQESIQYDFSSVVSKYEKVCDPEFGFELVNIDEYNNLIYVNRRNNISLKILPEYDRFEMSSTYLIDTIPIMYKTSFLKYNNSTFSEIYDKFKKGLSRLIGD